MDQPGGARIAHVRAPRAARRRQHRPARHGEAGPPAAMKRAGVAFPSGELELRGSLYLPDGDGPLPTLIWCHGSERSPRPVDELGRFYTSAGFALFAPHPRGHGLSAGDYAFDSDPGGIGGVIALFESHLDDTLAAVEWVRGHPDLDGGRIALSGVSHGAIQTILAAEAHMGAAHVAFAPAAIGWAGNGPLQERL